MQDEGNISKEDSEDGRAMREEERERDGGDGRDEGIKVWEGRGLREK